ncbi:MAG: hypothetical protein ACK5MA_03355 [Parachlamydiaceae bacterium]
MYDLPIKNQWRVLFPRERLDFDSLLQAKNFGYNSVLVDQQEESSPLMQIVRMETERTSPWELELKEQTHKAIYWKSKLDVQHFKEELLKRALLPLELYLEEIAVIRKAFPRTVLFYELPDAALSIHKLLEETPSDLFFLFSHVQGAPKRLDLPPHPWINVKNSRLIPLYDAEPMTFADDAKGKWPYLYPFYKSDSFAVMTPAWSTKPNVQKQLKAICGNSSGDFLKFDAQLSLLQAIADGECTLKLEEMRLLSDLFLAKIRWEAARGEELHPHELIKSLLIQVFKIQRFNVPPQLNLSDHVM